MVSSRLLFLTTGVGFAAIVYYGAGCCRRHVCDDKHTVFFFQFFFPVCRQNTCTRRHSQMHTPAHAQTHAYCMCTCVYVHDCVLFRCQAILIPTKCCRNIYYVGMCKCKYMVYLTYLMICDATSCAFFLPFLLGLHFSVNNPNKA